MSNTINLNPIPYLTWTWLKLNSDKVTYDFSINQNDGEVTQLPDGVEITEGKLVKTELPEPEFSIGKEAASLICDASKGKIYTFTKTNEDSKPLIIRVNAESNSATYNIIHAKAGTTCRVIMVYKGQAALCGVVTKIYAEEGAEVQLAKVQLCDKSVNQIDDTAVVCGDRAKVSFIQIELGGSHIDAGFHATLEGYESKFVSDTAYICQGTQYLDMNQVVVHTGKKTDCNMKTDGTVKDDTSKTYRGTIDMRKGCSGSTGNEMETTLLLSPQAVVKAAPIILCGEDDISAEHGSTIGKLSPEMLFYMNTRRIDQATAEELLTQAKISAAAANIPDQAVQNEILDFLN
ncbi:MAG: SufD family Fe-S cluster assembly protein [Treponema sp.]|nr:SufD family Fe-S cluster assembly protein [Treponema sp.]